MTTTVIGATGKVGSAVVIGLLEVDRPVRAYVRDLDKARRMFGQQSNLELRSGRIEDVESLRDSLDGASTTFMALGSIGLEGNLQRLVIDAARRSETVEQVVRLSVLNASSTSLGINQRAHWDIDFAAAAAKIPYATIRSAIFSASLLAASVEIRDRHSWTGLADTGRVGLVDHRDVAEVAVRILTNPRYWGQNYDLTGPELLSWPDAMRLLSAELSFPVTFETEPVPQLLNRLISAGVSPGQAELLIARDWAIQAGENELLTDTVRDITGHDPATLAAFLHENREQFLRPTGSEIF